MANSGSRQAVEEEMRAEVEVLNSRLEKTRILNNKLAASLARLETHGKSVKDAISPIYSDTQKLQVFGTNIDGLINAIEKIRQPSDIKTNEEDIIRRGPENAGLSSFLNSVKRVNRVLSDLREANLRSNQTAVADLTRLMRTAMQQLETYFRNILMDESSPLEPLQYITKDKPFPVLPLDKMTRLGLINSAIASIKKPSAGDVQLSSVYTSVRGQFLMLTLQNLAAATLQTLRKKSPNDIYEKGTNGMAIYAKGIELAYLAEYDNICALFSRDEWGKIFTATCNPSLSDLTRTFRDINAHVKANLNTDCYLAYEVIEIVSQLSSNLETKTGELKPKLAAALKQVRETAKLSLGELLDGTRRTVANLPSMPQDAATIPITTDTINRLQTMLYFLRPISSIMISLGDNGWKSNTVSMQSTDQIPSLNLFDVGADGQQIFANYSIDTIDTLLSAFEQRAKIMLKSKATQGVFLANNATVVERLIRNSDLQPLLSSRMAEVDRWRRNGELLYMQVWREPAAHLFDKSYTNRPSANTRPPSGSGGSADSLSVVKGLSSKEKDGIKEKFRLFNTTFDDLVAKHKALNMEREVRESLSRQVQQTIEPLYGRFWDRYHEIDKGKGKYVRYDRSSIATVFFNLS